MTDKLTVHIATRLTEDDAAKLTLLAQQEDRTEGWLIRKAILDYLSRYLKS